LFAVLITSFCFGIAVVLFTESVGTLVRKRRSTGKLNLPLAIPSALIFMFATVNVLGIWNHIYTTFVVHGDDPLAFLNLIRSPQKTVIQTGQVGAILLADALVVYRTFILWSNNIYVIVIPFLTFVATFTSGASFVSLQHRTDVETSIFATAVTQWTVSFLLCSFATTMYSTGLITYKLVNTQRNLRQHGISTSGGLSHRIMRIIVESAALYSLNHLLYAVLYEAKNQVESTPSFLEATVASITCSLIIVRSEEAINHPQTLPTSLGSYPSKDQLASGKEHRSQDGKVFAFGSMEGNVEVSRSSDEDV